MIAENVIKRFSKWLIERDVKFRTFDGRFEIWLRGFEDRPCPNLLVDAVIMKVIVESLIGDWREVNEIVKAVRRINAEEFRKANM